MNSTSGADSAPTGRAAGGGIFDEPSISRQWVARRLQRALSLERWGGPLRSGFAQIKGTEGDLLAKHADAAERRAGKLYDLIRAVGAEPYGSIPGGASVARAAVGLLARISRPLARRLSHRLAEHTLSEYENLGALAQDAPGVSSEIAEAIEPMYGQVLEEFHDLDPAR